MEPKKKKAVQKKKKNLKKSVDLNLFVVEKKLNSFFLIVKASIMKSRKPILKKKDKSFERLIILRFQK